MSGFLEMTPDWKKHWRGMPEFGQRDLYPWQSVTVNFRNPEDREAFAALMGQAITSHTQSIWHPRQPWVLVEDKPFVSEELRNPRHPVYVISKGRWESRLTHKSLIRMKVPHKVVIEPQERKKYARVIPEEMLLILPFSNLGQGSIPARNWVWQHAVDSGSSWHWIMDDNIGGFYRMLNNQKIPARCGNIFAAAEAFVDRYSNIGQAGLHYYMFAPRKMMFPPFTLNSRVYSCILLKNDLPLEERWRGRYNEDTDLSLRILKSGLCTVLFTAFLARKKPTMTMKGGNTDELYAGDGRLEMARSLKRQHPDVTRIVKRFGRWQHLVDYSRFKTRLRLKDGIDLAVLDEVDNFGMHLDSASYRPLLIGQAPSEGGDPDRPLEGRIAKKLADLSGVSVEEYLERTERANVLNRFPGKNGKGDAFPMEEAEAAAAKMAPKLRARRVVFLGSKVAKAFGEGDLKRLSWTRSRRLKCEVALLPHPSGISTWWNDPKNRRAAARFLSQLLEDVA